jgi:hypothetical protein
VPSEAEADEATAAADLYQFPPKSMPGCVSPVVGARQNITRTVHSEALIVRGMGCDDWRAPISYGREV